MARLTQGTKDKILADFHIGKSQNFLAKEYECSPATINKICKGVIPKYKDKVNSVVAIKSELSKESEYQSECFDKEVNTKLRRAGLVFGFLENALKKNSEILQSGYVEDKINIGDGVQKFENRKISPKETKELIDGAVSIGKSFGVIESLSKTQINNNNANVQENKNLTVEFK